MTNDSKINWLKEVTDCIDEIKFGIESKDAVKVPNLITLEGSLDLVSVDFSNKKGMSLIQDSLQVFSLYFLSVMKMFL